MDVIINSDNSLPLAKYYRQMKHFITSLLILIIGSISLQAKSSAKAGQYTVVGFAGKDTLHIGKATVKNGTVTLKLSSYQGPVQLIPDNEAYRSIRKHLNAVFDIRSHAAFEAAMAYVADTLPFDVLYTSGMWKDYIQQWVSFYANTTSDEKVFAVIFMPAVERVMARTVEDHPQTAIRLSKDLFEFFGQYSLADASERLAAYCLALDLRDAELDRLCIRLLNATGLLYKPAPTIYKTDGSILVDFPLQQPVLLVFYETKCGHCDRLMSELTRLSSQLEKKGYRIITLSSDKDKSLFEQQSSKFNWADNFCDFKGIDSPNFVNYGVSNTPVVYTINEEGRITGRYSVMPETEVKL